MIAIFIANKNSKYTFVNKMLALKKINKLKIAQILFILAIIILI